MATEQSNIQPARARRTIWRTIATLTILLPCLYGFGNKFIELIHTYQGDSDGAFAVTPIVNYLLASAGFLLLLGWAAINGMFRDIEGPKHTMLETERQLDMNTPVAPGHHK
jgi:hypothetical protein